MVDAIGSKFKGYAPLLIRVTLATIVIIQGAQTLPTSSSPPLGTLFMSLIQLLGGLFILIGLFTRWVAAALVVVVFLHIYRHYGFSAVSQEPRQVWFAALMMSLALWGWGAGDVSIDERQRRKEKG